MIFIKLSTRHKISDIVIAILLAIIILVFAYKSMGNSNESIKETINNDTSTAQFCHPTDECTVTTQISGTTSLMTLVTTETTTSATTTATTVAETTTSRSAPKITVTQTDVIRTTTSIIITEPTITSANVGQDTYIQHYTNQDAIDIAKVLYHECRGIPSKTEKACVAWVILNRVDYYNSTVYSVVREPYQFAFYPNAPVWNELYELAQDVLNRWSREKNGETNVGRVLPKEYLYFVGDGRHNYFRNKYSGAYNIWNYVLESPYES